MAINMFGKNNITIIKPKPKWHLINLKELWFYRELFVIFAWRDIKVRYKQTALGIAWAIFQPLTQTFVFTVFFGKLAKIPSGKLPYSLFVLIGLVFWGYFSGILSRASSSMVDNESIVKKIYFPRLILPLSNIVTNLIDFIISFTMLGIFAVYLGFIPNTLALLLIPLGLIIATLGASGLGLFLSAINIKYRDVRYILPFFIQMMLFLSPIIYPSSIVRPSNRLVLALNPMTGVIEAIRTTFEGGTAVNWEILGISAVSSLALFIFGLYFFKATERFFADIL